MKREGQAAMTQESTRQGETRARGWKRGPRVGSRGQVRPERGQIAQGPINYRPRGPSKLIKSAAIPSFNHGLTNVDLVAVRLKIKLSMSRSRNHFSGIVNTKQSTKTKIFLKQV